MERKLIQKLVKLFVLFYVGINLVGVGLESKFDENIFNFSSLIVGALFIFIATAYCITKCVITYLNLTNVASRTPQRVRSGKY
ncbi:hypothetical protein DI53_3243 [Sphingobacterium deserti]|uniref:Uncharacterized protein n=1 Tax=Sphingobacterium deserti TaxID=1229276 RepID=A0A0B8SZL5_9SPHI|nr:hypothetical protein DI53_3243 [Sphingobacterium deserti]